jgi:hypothetical protein
MQVFENENHRLLGCDALDEIDEGRERAELKAGSQGDLKTSLLKRLTEQQSPDQSPLPLAGAIDLERVDQRPERGGALKLSASSLECSEAALRSHVEDGTHDGGLADPGDTLYAGDSASAGRGPIEERAERGHLLVAPEHRHFGSSHPQTLGSRDTTHQGTDASPASVKIVV